MEEFSKEKFYEDILYMFGVIKEHHPNLYYKISEEELNSLIENYMKDESIDTLDKSLYYLYGIMVRIGDSHTKLNAYYNPSNYKFKIIDGECLVSKAMSQEFLIGAKLTKINEIPVSKILEEFRNVIVPRTEEGILARVEQYLANKAMLFVLPSIYPSTDIEYCFIKDNKEYKYKENVFDIDYSKFQKPKHYEYKVINNIVYIKYIKCRDMDDYTFKNMIEEIKSIENIDGYIIDIRGNEGGNSEVINPLIEFLKDKKIVTLVDKYVFSSGIMAYKKLKDLGSTVIGTPIAETANNFGDVLHGKTPNYDLEFIYSTKYFTIINNEWISLYGKKEYDEFISKEENKRYLEPIYFYPDIYASITKEDIINGTDSVIDLAIEMLNKEIESDKRK